MPTFRGSMVAVVTPMHGGVSPDAPIDWDRFENLLDFHVSQGTDAIVAIGTTGESATLSEREHCDAVARVVAHINGRVPVIAGTGANSTTEAIRLTECAAEAGANACLLVTPYYNKPTQEGLYQHFKAIADATNLPLIVYNIPGRTARLIEADTLAEIATHPNVVATKDSVEDTKFTSRCRQLLPDDFLMLPLGGTREIGSHKGFGLGVMVGHPLSWTGRQARRCGTTSATSLPGCHPAWPARSAR